MVQSSSLLRIWESKRFSEAGGEVSRRKWDSKIHWSHRGRIKGFGRVSSLRSSERRSPLRRRPTAPSETTHGPGPGSQRSPRPWRVPVWLAFGCKAWREGALGQFNPAKMHFTHTHLSEDRKWQNVTTFLEGNWQHLPSLKHEYPDPVIPTYEVVPWH